MNLSVTAFAQISSLTRPDAATQNNFNKLWAQHGHGPISLENISQIFKLLTFYSLTYASSFKTTVFILISYSFSDRKIVGRINNTLLHGNL